MAHVNVKPLEKTRVYETTGQAITHILLHRIWAKEWDFGGKPFGQTIQTQRAINDAIKANNAAAFVAFKRKGYWRVELANQ